MTEIYINKKKVDLGDDISILLLKSRTDYTNPTAVKNSFSKTITLPGTNSNNALFNEIWQLDRTQWLEAYNPSKRVEFELITDGTLDETGYVKLNKISKSSGAYSYDITLYGELGNILYELSYNVNDETKEVRNLTLGDLIFETRLDFSINRDMIVAAWDSLKNNTDDIYQTLNFAPAYNGKPKANKFDASKVWVAEYNLPGSSSSIWGDGRTIWNTESAGPQTFAGMPRKWTIEGTDYELLHTMISKMDPDEHYGLVELPDQITDLEARDFRSYLLRPVLRLSKVFEALDRYIYEKKGWHINFSDPFFEKEEYTNAWITLSMLYDINPDVESYTYFTQEDLLSRTDAPFKYLVSFCKMYGIYLDVNVTSKTLTLCTMKNFFNDTTEDLVLNEGKEVSIDPLSFNKSSYTFDFGEDADADFISKYNASHEVPYGSKKVNTGYQFDNASEKYIKDNIFKNAVDAVEQSPYYKFSKNYPAALYDNDAAFLGGDKEIKYTLFADGEAEGTESPRISYTLKRNNSGLYYTTPRYTWAGLQPGVYQDDFPKIQLHDESNDGIDGSNVIIYFRGMTTPQVATPSYSSPANKVYWMSDAATQSAVFYNVSDDSQLLKRAIGKNAWINNAEPGMGYGYTGPVTCINEIPNFTREDYDYTDRSDLFVDRNFGGFPVQAVNGCYTNTGTQVQYMSIVAQNYNGTADDVYFYHPIDLIEDHKYLILASIKVQDGTYLGDLRVPYAGVNNATLIDSLSIESTDKFNVVGSIMIANESGAHELFPFKMPNPSVRQYYVHTRWFMVYDLTARGWDINTMDEALGFLGIPTGERDFVGTPYEMILSHDFSTPTEIYIPGVVTSLGNDIYDRYWRDYIADLYSIDTRIIDAEIYLPEIHDSFKKFYWYNNALWCLSSISDWNPETKICKAKLLKINNKGNYVNYLEINPATYTAPHSGGSVTLTFQSNIDTGAISWTSYNDWITDNNGRTAGIAHGEITINVAANPDHTSRNGSIAFDFAGRTYIYNIHQESDYLVSVSIFNGRADYEVTPEYVSRGDEITLTILPKTDYYIDRVYFNGVDVTNSVVDNILTVTADESGVAEFKVYMKHEPTHKITIINRNPQLGRVWATDLEGEEITQVIDKRSYYINFEANSGYYLNHLNVNGSEKVYQLTEHRLLVDNVIVDQNIIASFDETYPVTLEIIVVNVDSAVITADKIA